MPGPKYVSDFTFPSSFGFTGSSPDLSTVRSYERKRPAQYAKGGRVAEFAKGGMTRKTFVRVAANLRRQMEEARAAGTPDSGVRKSAEDFANLFAESNERFDRKRFMDAAGLSDAPPVKKARGGIVTDHKISSGHALQPRAKSSSVLDEESGGKSALRPGFAKGGKPRSRNYVGYRGDKREVFRSRETPTEQTHGKDYGAVVGPFRTRRGAEFMRESGRAPHPINVSEAERLSKPPSKYAKGGKAMGGPVQAASGGATAVVAKAMKKHVAAPEPRGHGVKSAGKMRGGKAC